MSYTVSQDSDMARLRAELVGRFPELASAKVIGGFRRGSISFDGLEIPHFRSVLTSALQKSVRRQMPNQAERAIVLLLFLISRSTARDRKATLTMLKKRLVVTAVEDAFCFRDGAAVAAAAWGEEGEIRPEGLILAARGLSSNGTCRYANGLKREKGMPEVLAARSVPGSKRWASLDPEMFAELTTALPGDGASVAAIQRCIRRMYRGKAQRVSKRGKAVGDFTLLLVAIRLLRQRLEFVQVDDSSEPDPVLGLESPFHRSVYDEHSGVRKVQYAGCGNVTRWRFAVVTPNKDEEDESTPAGGAV